ncbi:MAG TPA: hypothetical protein VIV11_03470 [Kofleriaceae bacterium]
MFVGHYGPAFALKRWAPSTPLIALFLGVQLVDIAWAIFVLAGIEHVRIVPGITETNALDLFYMPYTHGLVAGLLWSVAAGAVTWLATRRQSLRPAIAVALAVLSHWLLDLIMHRRDLPIFDDSYKVGLGLWHHRWPALALELVTLWAGLVLYARGTRARDRIGGLGLWIFGVALAATQVILLLGEAPPTPSATAASALAGYIVLAVVAWWIDRHRERR